MTCLVPSSLRAIGFAAAAVCAAGALVPPAAAATKAAKAAGQGRQPRKLRQARAQIGREG